MFEEEGYQVMWAAFEVYNQLGYGMAEEIYQQSLEIELELGGIPFRSKCELAVVYKGRQLETHYKPDLLVYEGIVVELKAVAELISDHEAQIFNYMRIARQVVGYLINYGCKRELEWKRFIITDLKTPDDKKGNANQRLSSLIFSGRGAENVNPVSLESMFNERLVRISED